MLWLVHWHHVASIVDSKEAERVLGLDLTHNFPLSIFVVFELQCIEFRLKFPVECRRPGLASFPVANEVFIARVYQSSDSILQQEFDVFGLTEHPVARQGQRQVGHVIATFPVVFLGSDCSNGCFIVQEVLYRGEVVTEGQFIAFESDVLVVLASKGQQGHDLCEVALLNCGVTCRPADHGGGAALDEQSAHGERSLHDALLHSVDDLVVLQLVRVFGLLQHRVHQAVSDSNPLEVDFVGCTQILVVHLGAQGWHLVAPLTFAHNLEVIRSQLRVFLEESVEERLHVGGHGFLGGNVVHGLVALAESAADGLVDPNDVGIGVPRVGVQRQVACRVHFLRAILHEQGQHS